MTDDFAADVLICGAGAAGLTLAIDLARRGRVVSPDRQDGRSVSRLARQGHPAAHPGGVRGSRHHRPHRRGRRPLSAAAGISRRRQLRELRRHRARAADAGRALSHPADGAAIPDRSACCASACRARRTRRNSAASCRVRAGRGRRDGAARRHGRRGRPFARAISSAPTAAAASCATRSRSAFPARRWASAPWSPMSIADGARPRRLASLQRRLDGEADVALSARRNRACSSCRHRSRSRARSISPPKGLTAMVADAHRPRRHRDPIRCLGPPPTT